MGVNLYYVDFNAAGGGDGSIGTPWNNSQDAFDGAVTDGSNPAYCYYRADRTEEPTAEILVDTNSGDDDVNRIFHIADRFGDIWAEIGEVLIKPTSANTQYAIDFEGESYISLRGMEIQPYRHGVEVADGSQTERNITIEECWIHANRITSNDLQGIVVSKSGEVIVRNNIISDFSLSSHWCSGIYIIRALNVYVYNNTVYDIAGGGSAQKGNCIYMIHTNTAGSYLDVIIKNNIFQKSSHFLITISNQGDNTNISVVSDYNCFYLDGVAGAKTGRDYDLPAEYTTLANWQGSTWSTDANSIDDDPEMVDPGNGDFHLGGSSPCIGAGTTLVSVVYDKDHEARAVPYDIGAYLYPVILTGQYYVKNGGDNSKSGLSWENAWETVVYAVDNIVLPDELGARIHVASGTYVGAITPSVSGISDSRRVTIRGDVGNDSGEGSTRPIFKGDFAGNLMLLRGTTMDYFTIDQIQFDCVEVGAGANNDGLELGSYLNVYRCLFNDAYQSAIRINSPRSVDCKIINNIFVDCGEASTYATIWIVGYSYVSGGGIRIYNNHFIDSDGPEIRVYFSTSAARLPDTIFKNNVTNNNSYRFLVVHGEGGATAFDKFLDDDLTCNYNQYYNYVIIYDAISDIAVWRSTYGHDVNGAAELTIDTNTLYDANYNPVKNSPLIAAGEVLAEVTDDYNGVSRGDVNDVGALKSIIITLINKKRWGYLGLRRCGDWTESTNKLFERLVDWVMKK